MKNFTTKAILIFLFITGFSFSQTTNAQKLTALVSNGVTTMFGSATQFADAYNAATTGDTIYLPGGPIAPVTIDKSIAIYGAGYHPDSTQATSATYLTSGIVFNQNADSASITGVEVNGSISTTHNHKVDYLVISRCDVKGISIVGSASTSCTHVTIKECVIRGGVGLANATYSNISNNIVEGQIAYGSNNAIYNNIILKNSGYNYYDHSFNSINNSHIANNILFTTYVLYSCNTNTLSNNIFVNTQGGGTNTFENNYNDVDISTVFVNQTGDKFDFAHDYNLVSPATYQGFDATEVGIYGGLHPFKDGGLPNNPHVQTKDIAIQTDSNGDLHIEIKVAAQDK